MKIDYCTRADPGVTNANVTRASLLGAPSSLGAAFKDADYGGCVTHYPAPLSVHIKRIAWVASAVMLAGAFALWMAA